MAEQPILDMRGVSKKFGGLIALDKMDFSIAKGEIHALVGENGAGKSTLIKIFGGVHTCDSGVIRYQGKEVRFSSPAHSMEAGIAIIYQELSALPSLSVIENLYMGAMPGRFGLVNWQDLAARARRDLAAVGLTLDPYTRMDRLSISQRQLVEIAKALSKNASIIVMDEPNSSLSPAESERLFAVIGQLKKNGISVIYISHKLDEVIRIADRITVLRDGRLIGALQRGEADENALIRMMVGRELVRKYIPRQASEEKLLEVKNLTGKGFRNVSFDLRKGEILCFAGLVGAGRSEVMRALIGAEPWRTGNVVYKGREARFASPKEAVKAGVVMLQEDRKRLSLFMGLPIAFNISIGALPFLKKFGVIDTGRVTKVVRGYADVLSIKMASLAHPVKSLSGGNQQKTIIARWLALNPSLLILDEPTHGVDVGAKSEIYNLIRKLADSGMGIILISSELPEVLAMADRVAVMCGGSIQALLPRSEGLSEEKIMRYAAGCIDDVCAV